MINTPLTLDVILRYWESKTYRNVMLPALGAFTCGEVAQIIRESREQLPRDVIRLVIAARNIAFDDTPNKEALKELDDASEAFASRVPWENEPEPASPSPQDDLVEQVGRAIYERMTALMYADGDIPSDWDAIGPTHDKARAQWSEVAKAAIAVITRSDAADPQDDLVERLSEILAHGLGRDWRSGWPFFKAGLEREIIELLPHIVDRIQTDAAEIERLWSEPRLEHRHGDREREARR